MDLVEFFHKKYYPDLSAEQVASAFANPEVAEKAYSYVNKKYYPDLPPEKVKRVPIIVDNPKDPRLRAYNDSMNVYVQYRDKKQPELKGRLPENFQKELDLLKRKSSFWDDRRYKELDDIDLKIKNGEIPKSERANLYKDVSSRYDKIVNPIELRVNYINQVEKVYDNVNWNKYDFDSPDKNFNVKGMKPIKWDSRDVEFSYGGVETGSNQYGSIITSRTGSGNSEIKKQYSPVFKKPVQPVVYQKGAVKTEQKPVTTNTSIENTQQASIESQPVITKPEEPKGAVPNRFYYSKGSRANMMEDVPNGFYTEEQLMKANNDAIKARIAKKLASNTNTR